MPPVQISETRNGRKTVCLSHLAGAGRKIVLGRVPDTIRDGGARRGGDLLTTANGGALQVALMGSLEAAILGPYFTRGWII